MTRPLDLSAEELARAAAEIARLISERHVAREADPGVVIPRVDPEALRAALHTPLPAEPTSIDRLLEEIRDRIIPSGRRNDSPRFFGYVCSGGSDVGALGDFLASGINQNVTAWRSSPSGTELERVVVDWLRRILGLPEGTDGLLLGGGSSATLTALAAARDAKAGADVSQGGMITLGRPMTLYATDEVHMSVPRAASLLGIGRDGVRVLPSRPDFTFDLTALRERIREDREDGAVPFCVVANAGSTNTGAVDPLRDLAVICREEGLWLHVDAAYGGFAALSPDLRRRLDGIEEADSVAIDPHKWLHVPFDCGALLVRDQAALRAPYTEVGEYARSGETGPRTSYTFFERSPELSRRFRALKLWMILRYYGTSSLREMVEQDVSVAGHLAAMVDAADELERLAPAPLSVVCFRYAPPGMDEPSLDGINREILRRVQLDAVVYPTHAELRGRFAIRACILNPRTRPSDVDLLVAEVLRHGRELKG
ncbi:MAG: aminotransferase class I/II-fold pyridoxal phosphate-dependent enzyme [Acidobacteria bacterium]|nr:aminotransferase class I/II-fold pyridoxal phosphate-dependent enzyme [Acidobacteriota bacterium]